MKSIVKKIFSTHIALFLIVIVGFTSCGKDNDMLIGKWKLMEVIITTDYQEMDTIDYSSENIVYDFQKNNRLIITGNISDDLYVFKDFQAGKHSYKCYNFMDDVADPKNLLIDEPKSGEVGKEYNCYIGSETLEIFRIEIIYNGTIPWSKSFVRLK
jgi:hypothetical protein